MADADMIGTLVNTAAAADTTSEEEEEEDDESESEHDDASMVASSDTDSVASTDTETSMPSSPTLLTAAATASMGPPLPVACVRVRVGDVVSLVYRSHRSGESSFAPARVAAVSQPDVKLQTRQTPVVVHWYYTYHELGLYLQRHKIADVVDIQGFEGYAQTNHSHRCRIGDIQEYALCVPPLLCVEFPEKPGGTLRMITNVPTRVAKLRSWLDRHYLAFLMLVARSAGMLADPSSSAAAAPPPSPPPVASATATATTMSTAVVTATAASRPLDLIFYDSRWLHAHAYEIRSRLRQWGLMVFGRFGPRIVTQGPILWQHLFTPCGRIAARVFQLPTVTSGTCCCCGLRMDNMTRGVLCPVPDPPPISLPPLPGSSVPYVPPGPPSGPVDDRCATFLMRLEHMDVLIMGHATQLSKHRFSLDAFFDKLPVLAQQFFDTIVTWL